MIINEEVLGSLWKDLSLSPSVRIMQVTLEGIISSIPERRKSKERVKYTSSATRKRRGYALWRPGMSYMARVERKVRTYTPKGYDTRILEEIWDRRYWKVRKGISEVLQMLIEKILR